MALPLPLLLPLLQVPLIRLSGSAHVAALRAMKWIERTNLKRPHDRVEDFIDSVCHLTRLQIEIMTNCSCPSIHAPTLLPPLPDFVMWNTRNLKCSQHWEWTSGEAQELSIWALIIAVSIIAFHCWIVKYTTLQVHLFFVQCIAFACCRKVHKKTLSEVNNVRAKRGKTTIKIYGICHIDYIL